MKFWCLNYAYRELAEQMHGAKLSIWNNKWSDIYDFTPSATENHFELHIEGGEDFVTPLEHFEQQVKRIKYEEEEDHGGIELDEINIELDKA